MIETAVVAAARRLASRCSKEEQAGVASGSKPPWFLKRFYMEGAAKPAGEQQPSKLLHHLQKPSVCHRQQQLHQQRDRLPHEQWRLGT